jgi:hypothetical protein
MGGAVMMKTASQISDEVLEKLAAKYQRRMQAAGVPQEAQQAATQYAQGHQTADPLRGGTQTLERHIGSQQLKNPGMSRGQAMPGPKPGQLPGGNTGMLSGLMGRFKKLPTLGKAGIIGGAALGAYGLGKHFFGGNDQPKQQYSQW